GRRRRPLGATGAARGGEQVAAAVPEAERGTGGPIGSFQSPVEATATGNECPMPAFPTTGNVPGDSTGGEIMEKKIAGLLGAVATLGAFNAAQAAPTPSPAPSD